MTYALAKGNLMHLQLTCADMRRNLFTIFMRPSIKWGYIALLMSVGWSVRLSVGRPNLVRMITSHRVNLGLLNFAQTFILGWLVVLGFNATLTAKVISWWSVTQMCFPGFLTPVLTQLFFPKLPTTFLTFILGFR